VFVSSEADVGQSHK